MADHTHIEWTDATWNPITGCSVVSAGCKHCYAMKLAGTRLQHHPSRAGLTTETKAGPVWNGQVRFNEQWLDQPLRWKRPRRIFVCAHGDLFHESVPDEWIDRVFAVMAGAHRHTFQVLTKRPDRARRWFDSRHLDPFFGFPDEVMRWKIEEPVWSLRDNCGMPWPLENVWLGVSVEDQAAADERIPLLLQTPAAVRWISAEPLLGPVDLKRHLFQCCGCPHPGDPGDGFYDPPSPPSCCNEPDRTELHWVVAGGESGTGARPMHPDWARSLRDQCAAAGVPFLFKQWGGWRPPLEGEDYDTSKGQAQRVPCFIVGHAGTVHCFENGEWTARGEVMRQVGKKAAGRLLDGVQHDGYPEQADG